MDFSAENFRTFHCKYLCVVKSELHMISPFGINVPQNYLHAVINILYSIFSVLAISYASAAQKSVLE